jgi:hypothetical protein
MGREAARASWAAGASGAYGAGLLLRGWVAGCWVGLCGLLGRKVG